jgi:hypothetical protein
VGLGDDVGDRLAFSLERGALVLSVLGEGIEQERRERQSLF